MEKFNAIFDTLVDSLAFIAAFFIFFMMGIECYEIIARYYLSRPLIWGVDVCEYMLFLLTFLGTTWVLKKGAHVSVNILVDHLKPRTQIYCDLVVSLIGIFVSLIILWISVKASWECYVSDIKVVKTFPQPKWFFLSFISLGYLLLLIEFIRQFLGHLRNLVIERV